MPRPRKQSSGCERCRELEAEVERLRAENERLQIGVTNLGERLKENAGTINRLLAYRKETRAKASGSRRRNDDRMAQAERMKAAGVPDKVAAKQLGFTDAAALQRERRRHRAEVSKRLEEEFALRGVALSPEAKEMILRMQAEG